MVKLVTRNYWWPGVTKEVKQYVEGCDQCQRIKNRAEMPAGKLRPNKIPEKLWQHILVDFIMKLPVSKGHDSILVVCDCHMQVHLSRNNIPTVKPPPNHTSLPSTVATFLTTHFMAVLQPSRYSVFHGRNTVMNLFLRVGNKNNSCIRETQENSIEFQVQSSLSYILIPMVRANYCAPYPK